MPSFSFVDNDILIDGVSSSKVAGTLRAAGLAESRIGEILGFWYVGATGRTRPAPFDFRTDVQESDPACEVTYARTFEHVDWVDGEDRVQATATPEELGFNARFHSIENEFDEISRQFRTLGACAQELRSDLVGVVRELESKLTALQNDIVELRQEADRDRTPRSPGFLGTVRVGDRDAFITEFAGGYKLVEFAGQTLGGTTQPPVLDPGVGVVFDPGLAQPDDLVRILEGVEDAVTIPAIRELVERPQGATIAEVRAHAGGLTLPSGETMASVLAAMPADTTLMGVAGAVDTITANLVSALPEETVKAATETVITDGALRTGTVDELRGADAAAALGVDAVTVGALAGAGVDTTVAGLAGATTEGLAGSIAGAGAAVRPDTQRAAIARARLASAIRGRV